MKKKEDEWKVYFFNNYKRNKANLKDVWNSVSSKALSVTIKNLIINALKDELFRNLPNNFIKNKTFEEEIFKEKILKSLNTEFESETSLSKTWKNIISRMVFNVKNLKLTKKSFLEELKNNIILSEEDKKLLITAWRKDSSAVKSRDDEESLIDEWKGENKIEIPFNSETGNESIIGQDDFQEPWFLEKGYKKSKAICFIIGKGTGFLIKKNIILTNHHIFRKDYYAKNKYVVFGYENNEEMMLNPDMKRYLLKPSEFFHNNDKLDYAAVYIEGDPGIEWGIIPPDEEFDYFLDETKTNRVNIIQHPGGDPKKIAVRANQAKFIGETTIQYLTDTEKGSSGSPVFDERWKLIGVHFRSSKDLIDGSPIYYNEAHRIDKIWEDFEQKLEIAGLL